MITHETLKKIDNHWAVSAVGNQELRESILQFSKVKLVKNAVGEQLVLNLDDPFNDEDALKRLAMAYEMAAIEGMNDFIDHTDNDELQDQFLAGSRMAFEIYRVLEIPENDYLRFIFHLLHLSALAYCGDCWTDLKHIYDGCSTKIERMLPDQILDWDKRILFCLFDCWGSLFRKNSWEELNNIANAISKLRDEQTRYEDDYLKTDSNNKSRARAMRLMSLYHWAKATDLLSLYTLQGEPADIKPQLDRHFDLAIRISADCGDAQLEILLRWLRSSAEQMINGSVWWVARTINSKATRFIKNLANRAKPLLELLPPQKIALKELGLLDPAKTAVVVDMPTSGGKTLLAQFKILQAVNNFGETKGWVAYIAPTKALTAQITRRLRKDFSPIGIKVEKLSGAIEIDVLEEDLLNNAESFDVLVATPEKMQLVLRNHKIDRPLSLLVMDEAHNIEDENRGLRIELLLATVKQHYQARANFLLLMPYVENAKTLSRWLAHDRDAGLAISLSTSPWQPNERIVGLVEKQRTDGSGWTINYQTLVTSPKTIHLKGNHQIGGVRPINVPQSAANLSKIAAGCAKVFANRGTSILIARTQPNAWSLARVISDNMDTIENIPSEIELVQNYLKEEVSPEFELIEMLDKGIGIHHAGLSEEIKSLMEWLVEENKLKVLCATTTIAQGINFPVSSLFLQSIDYPYDKKMSYREFWNLAGRAGRVGQDNVGVVGIACDNDNKKRDLIDYVQKSTGDLVSRLVGLVNDLQDNKLIDEEKNEDGQRVLKGKIFGEQWEDFRCYIAHLLNEKKELQATLNEMDKMLSNTFGYSELRNSNARQSEQLLEAAKIYTKSIAKNMGNVARADMTGFSVESVKTSMQEINQLEYKLTPLDWMPDSLFGSSQSRLPDLFSVMFKIKQLNFQPDDTQGKKQSRMADIAKAWIDGKTIREIASNFFDGSGSEEISKVYKAIYGKLANGGTWGLSALSRMSVIDFDNLSDEQKRQLNLMPSMLYHGVKNEESVLMRMNSVPRSFAEEIGNRFKETVEDRNIATARRYLKDMQDSDWDLATSGSEYLSGKECKKLWQILSGESEN